MKSLITSLALAATSMASPAFAGLHDFNPAVDRRPAVPSVATDSIIPSSPTGNCFQTRDQSRVCYMELGNGVYFASLFDVDAPDYPIAMALNCRTGKWAAYSMELTKEQGGNWLAGFCETVA